MFLIVFMYDSIGNNGVAIQGDRIVLYKIYEKDGKDDVSKYKFRIDPSALHFVIQIMNDLKGVLSETFPDLYPKN